MVLLQSEDVKIGWKAPDFELKDTEDNLRSLNDFTDKQGILIVFSCNHCPYAQAAWPVLNNLYEQFGDKISFAAINPNDEEAYPEDSYENMKKWVEEGKVKFSYLRDKTQETARKYKAKCTPDPFLFRVEDGETKLFYHGRVVSDWKHPEESEEHNLRDAIKALLAGNPPPENQPSSIGCSIKWKS